MKGWKSYAYQSVKVVVKDDCWKEKADGTNGAIPGYGLNINPFKMLMKQTMDKTNPMV
jgi:hypothetical protein